MQDPTPTFGFDDGAALADLRRYWGEGPEWAEPEPEDDELGPALLDDADEDEDEEDNEEDEDEAKALAIAEAEAEAAWRDPSYDSMREDGFWSFEAEERPTGFLVELVARWQRLGIISRAEGAPVDIAVWQLDGDDGYYHMVTVDYDHERVESPPVAGLRGTLRETEVGTSPEEVVDRFGTFLVAEANELARYALALAPHFPAEVAAP